MSALMDVVQQVLHWMSLLFILVVGIIVLWLLTMYLQDRLQTEHAIRRNYPLIGRFRYLLESLGKFFRQYMFAADQDEKPFNRAQRSWVYRAAKGLSTVQSFGSTRDAAHPGKIAFVNCAFPMLVKDAVTSPPMVIGEGCKMPYRAESLFNISGMSYGALSRPAVRALSQGAKLACCWLNTGEGGVSPYHLESGCDLVAQIGTAKYGFRDKNGNLSNEKLREMAAYEQIRMFEIKLSQGAKPGKGGILPAAKVTDEVAEIRGIRIGEDSISPNRHPDIASNEDLLQMIEHIREVTGKPVGFKFVMGSQDWIDSLCRDILIKGETFAPDFITLDGAEGGTGSAPVALMDDVGMSINESLPLLIDTLNRYGLRSRIKVIASGKLINPTMVAWAIAMGADFVNSARGFMFSLGCIQSMQCHLDSCPTGITTHNPRLQRGLLPHKKSQRVANYHRNLMREVESIAHSCGVVEPRLLSRAHVRKVMRHGVSENFAELYPDVVADGTFKGITLLHRYNDPS
ncbi:FMN-binding glutamate synthase family protein [Thiomicrorhabdus xiamenensis]|uniref:FMN-binding glutamate synthase family protein n=1 Tax=Thiomicrorhabdus xiamenensis TaxID=2739063 RepID=A0A7D4NRN3_9GAMM|nr:FMN-binding glutamate synthase family protein [Thiomicrorhabdus xiamenensis]QKI89730.1 FMN-binding glutamate synthase family protein [Thiomicrorhabdus xiamenensis]